MTLPPVAVLAGVQRAQRGAHGGGVPRLAKMGESVIKC